MKNSILKLFLLFTFSLVAMTSRTQEKKEPWPGVTAKILTDNEHVKISEMTFAPGAIADWHPHPQHTVYAVTDVSMKEEVRDKEATTTTFKAGEAKWFPAVTHKVTNVGKTSFTAILTEIK